jgi:hypothetical protein
MVVSIEVSGKIIKWKAVESLNGLMGADTRGNTLMTRKKAMVSFTGKLKTFLTLS